MCKNWSESFDWQAKIKTCWLLQWLNQKCPRFKFSQKGDNWRRILIYEYNPETKTQSEEWKPWFASHQKALKSRSKIKMLIVFFNIRRVVHHEYVPEDKSVNAKFYVEVLKCLREHVRHTRLELWAVNAWILDNASSYSAFGVMREFLAKNITTITHSRYSPDLVPCDFYLFPKVKNIMRGEHFVAVVS